jgi:hypothetical protein
MLYCDLAIDGVTLWSSVPCLNCRLIDSYPYLGFIGHLAFDDSLGSNDPDYTGIGPGGRFALLYAQVGQDPLQIPLRSIPAQQFDISLGGQSCTISLYTR